MSNGLTKLPSVSEEELAPLFRMVADHFAGGTEVVAVYLYGSVLRVGTERAGDVDIGVLYRRERVPDGLRVLREQEELSDLLHKQVDLVVLNTASPILRMQVLRKGRCVLEKDHRLNVQFVVRTLQEYFDLKMVRRVIEEKLGEAPVLG